MNRLVLLFVFLPVSMIVYSQPEPIRIFHHPESFPLLNNIRFTPDGSKMITSGMGIRLWNFETGELIHEFDGISESIAFNSDYSLMATGYAGGVTALWDFNTYELVHVFEGHEKDRGPRSDFIGIVQWVTFSNHNENLITVANDGKAIVWDLKSKNSIHSFDSFYLNNPGLLFRSGPVSYSPDDKFIVFKHSVWNSMNFNYEFELNDNKSSQFVSFSNSGDYFISNANGDINIFDWDTKRLFKRFEVGKAITAVFNFDLSPNERFILAGSSDGNAYIIDIKTEEYVCITAKDNSIRINHLPVQFHPSGDYFAVGGDDGKVLIYDFKEVLASPSGVADWLGYE